MGADVRIIEKRRAAVGHELATGRAAAGVARRRRDGALATPSRLHLVLAAGQRSAETSGKAKAKAAAKAAAAATATTTAAKEAKEKIKKMIDDFQSEKNQKKRAEKGQKILEELKKTGSACSKSQRNLQRFLLGGPRSRYEER